MNSVAFVLFFLCTCAATGAGSKVSHFGPSDCVSVARSKEGSCLIKTNCAGRDTTEFDFAFDCFSQAKGRTRHSFGVGSFDDVEEYDTGVMCAGCGEPSEPTSMRGRSVAVVKAPAAQAKVLTAVGGQVQKAKVQQSPVQKGVQHVAAQHAPQTSATGAATSSPSVASSEKANYGPAGCVSTWRSKTTGTCMMETSCGPPKMAAAVNLTNYEFGLLCVTGKNELSQQLFGKDSFAHIETFDTLIKCTHCLGLDEVKVGGGGSAASAMTPDIAQDVAEIRSSLATMGTQIAALNAKVFPTAAAATAAAPAAAAPDSPSADVVGPPPGLAAVKPVKPVAAVAPALLAKAITPVAFEQNSKADEASEEDQEQPDDADSGDDDDEATQ